MLAITFAINEYSNFDISFFLITSILLFLFFSLIYFLKKEKYQKNFINHNPSSGLSILSSSLLFSTKIELLLDCR